MAMKIPVYREREELTTSPGKVFSLSRERRSPRFIPDVRDTRLSSVANALGKVADRIMDVETAREFNEVSDRYTTELSTKLKQIKLDRTDEWYNLDAEDASKKFKEWHGVLVDSLTQGMKYADSKLQFEKYTDGRRELVNGQIVNLSFDRSLKRAGAQLKESSERLVNLAVEQKDPTYLDEINAKYQGYVGTLFSKEEAQEKIDNHKRTFAYGTSLRHILDFPETAYDDFTNIKYGVEDKPEYDRRPKYFTMLDELDRTAILTKALSAQQTARKKGYEVNYLERWKADEMMESSIELTKNQGMGELGNPDEGASLYGKTILQIGKGYYDPNNPTKAAAKIEEFKANLVDAQVVNTLISRTIDNTGYNPGLDRAVTDNMDNLYPAVQKVLQEAMPGSEFKHINKKRLNNIAAEIDKAREEKYKILNNDPAEWVHQKDESVKEALGERTATLRQLQLANQGEIDIPLVEAAEDYNKANAAYWSSIWAAQQRRNIPFRKMSMLTNRQAVTEMNKITQAETGEEVATAAKDFISQFPSRAMSGMAMKDLVKNGLPAGLEMFNVLDFTDPKHINIANRLGNAFRSDYKELKKNLGTDTSLVNEKIKAAQDKFRSEIEDYRLSVRALQLDNPYLAERLNNAEELIMKVALVDATEDTNLNKEIKGITEVLFNNKFQYQTYRDVPYRIPANFNENRIKDFVDYTISHADVWGKHIDPEGSAYFRIGPPGEEGDKETREQLRTQMIEDIQNRGYVVTTEDNTGFYVKLDDKFVMIDGKYTETGEMEKMRISFKTAETVDPPDYAFFPSLRGSRIEKTSGDLPDYGATLNKMIEPAGFQEEGF